MQLLLVVSKNYNMKKFNYQIVHLTYVKNVQMLLHL